MRLAVITLSPSGLKTSLRIRELYPHAAIFCYYRLQEELGKEAEKICFFRESLSSFTGTVFHAYEGLVFVMAAGIAVRSVAPYLENKKTDPAVVVVDDTGFFAISLLSGHRGGANDLAQDLAAYLGAIPVITTSTDRHRVTAFDLLARRREWVMENEEDLKKISAAQVAGKELLIYVDRNIGIKLPGKYVVARSAGEFRKLLGLPRDDRRLAGCPGYQGAGGGPSRKWEGAVLISSRVRLPAVPPGLPFIVLRPRQITAGIGCRRGTPAEKIVRAVQDAFKRSCRKMESLQGLATVADKERETGLLEAAQFFHVPLQFIEREQIRAVEHLFTPSPFVKEQIGVASVAEPCAFLGSASGELILRKTKYPGITVALAESSLALSERDINHHDPKGHKHG